MTKEKTIQLEEGLPRPEFFTANDIEKFTAEGLTLYLCDAGRTWDPTLGLPKGLKMYYALLQDGSMAHVGIGPETFWIQTYFTEEQSQKNPTSISGSLLRIRKYIDISNGGFADHPTELGEKFAKLYYSLKQPNEVPSKEVRAVSQSTINTLQQLFRVNFAE